MDEQTIFNLLECSVCLEPLDVTSRVLPCQHTFCMRCLQQIINTRNELKCPECRELVPCRLVTDLPTNILLVRLLDGLKRPGKAPPGSPPPRTSNAGISGSGEMTVSGRGVSSKTSIQNQPCAMALYKYDAQEHGDLSFSKSDIILLHKKIDENWYQGVVMGASDQIGFFPASYVQVLTPLPPDPPQCKALYDFEVNEQEEKDCLTFNKDEVLNVIRRVDQNWVEGKKGDKIGIFPLSFVELNGTAKALVDAHAGIDSGSGPSHQSQGSGDAGSSPDQAGSSQEGGSKNKAKRHSFTSLLGLSSAVQSKNKDPQPSTSASTSTNNATSSSSGGNSSSSSSNRHSMEISSPVLVRCSNPTAANLIDGKVGTTSQQAAAGIAAAAAVAASTGATATTPDVSSSSAASSSRKKPAPLTGISQISASITRGPNSPSVAASPTVTQAGNVEFRFVADAPASPKPKVEVFVAMYSYKPTKTDELELKKGDFYTVTEKCKDGWFKGMAVKTGDLGVFPGNYMQAYRHDRSTRKATTTAPDSRPSQSTSTATSSTGQSIRPRLPSDAASRAASTSQRAMATEAPSSPSPMQGMRPRVLSDAASRIAAQRAAAAAATAAATDATTSSNTGLSSATTQTNCTLPVASTLRTGGQSSQPSSPALVQQERRTTSQVPDGQKTVAQLQSERAAQQLQFRPPPPNYPTRSGLTSVAQARATAAHPDRNVRGSPPTVMTPAAVMTRTSVSPAGVQQPQSPGVQTRNVGVSSTPISVRPRASSGQTAVGSPPMQNGILQRVRSPSSPQPGGQDGTTTNDGGNAVTKPRGSPVLGQGSPKGASASSSANQSTPPQVEVHLSSSASAKAKRHSAQITASAVEAQSRQQVPKPRRHSESDNDLVRSRRTVQAKATATQQHPPQSNAQIHPVASCPSALTTASTSQTHPSKQTVVVSSSSSQSHGKPSSPSLYKVSDTLPFTPPPNVTAPDCVFATPLAGPAKLDKQKDRKDRKASKKRTQTSPDEAAPAPLARISSLPDGQDAPSTDASPQPRHGQSLTLSATQGEGSGEETSQGAEGVSDGASAVERRDRPPKTTPFVRERYRVTVPYPPHSDAELELKVGETVFVHIKREDGWFKGTQQRTGKTGLFPGSFVESY